MIYYMIYYLVQCNDRYSLKHWNGKVKRCNVILCPNKLKDDARHLEGLADDFMTLFKTSRTYAKHVPSQTILKIFKPIYHYY